MTLTVHRNRYIHTYTHANIYAYIHTYIRTYIHTFVYNNATVPGSEEAASGSIRGDGHLLRNHGFHILHMYVCMVA